MGNRGGGAVKGRVDDEMLLSTREIKQKNSGQKCMSQWVYSVSLLLLYAFVVDVVVVQTIPPSSLPNKNHNRTPFSTGT